MLWNYSKYCSLFALIFAISGISLTIEAQVNYSANDVLNPYDGYFQQGVNPGYYGPKWTDSTLGDILAGNNAAGQQGAGVTAIRGSLPESIGLVFGYDIWKDKYEYNRSLGLTDNTLFLGFAHPDHKDPVDYCPSDTHQTDMFANLYEPIWDDNNGTEINENNYYAKYVYEVVSRLKDDVKFWEIWNEPGFDYSGVKGWLQPGQEGNWWENNPDPCDYKLRAPVFHYIRTLRISYDVIKTLAPDDYIVVAGVGYDSFLDVILRNTDNPVDGSVTAEYPLKGGAFFDVLGFHAYPHFDGATRYWDSQLGDFVYTRHSDAAADNLAIGRDRRQNLLASYGYDGITYPKKMWTITEINVPRREFFYEWGSEEAQRNYLMKAVIKSRQLNFTQLHVFNLAEIAEDNVAANEFDVMGLYRNLNNVDPYQQVINESGIAYKTMSDALYNTRFDQDQTNLLNLPANVGGGAFLKENGNFVYALWSKTQIDRSEFSSTNYSFPSALGISSLDKISWDYAQTGTRQNISAFNIPLDGAPAFFTNSSEANFTSIELDCAMGVEIIGQGSQSVGGAVLSWTAPTATTDCPGGVVDIQITQGVGPGGFFPFGVTEVQYTATDACGNVETCAFNVKVASNGGGIGDCHINRWNLGFMGEYDGHKYFLSINKLNWADAQAVCESHGGYLASINSAEENAFIAGQAYNLAYIGINDAAQEGNLTWPSGEAANYTNIADCAGCENAPPNDYAIMNYFNGTWYFVDGSTEEYFIMELPCDDASQSCVDVDPLSLQFVQDKIAIANNCEDGILMNIDVYEYNGEVYLYCDNVDNVPDLGDEVYTCQGDLYCMTSSIAGPTGDCINFVDNAVFVERLWSRINDCCNCTTEYDPVCGSDGITYSNACEADCAGVSYTAGACESNELEVVIGYCDRATDEDLTQGNVVNFDVSIINNGGTASLPEVLLVVAEIANDNNLPSSLFVQTTINLPAIPAGGTYDLVVPVILVNGSYVNGDYVDSKFYFNLGSTFKPVEEYLNLTQFIDTNGAIVHEAFCAECICTTEYDPVCSWDGVTYGNACEAECDGVFLYSEGACPTQYFEVEEVGCDVYESSRLEAGAIVTYAVKVTNVSDVISAPITIDVWRYLPSTGEREVYAQIEQSNFSPGVEKTYYIEVELIDGTYQNGVYTPSEYGLSFSNDTADELIFTASNNAYNNQTQEVFWIFECASCACEGGVDLVCGDDGLTYLNACEAICAGVTNYTSGPCDLLPDYETIIVDCSKPKPGLLGLGEVVTYTISVTNIGDGKSPPETKLRSGSYLQGPTANLQVDRDVLIGELLPGETWTGELDVELKGGMWRNGWSQWVYNVCIDEFDLNPGCLTASFYAQTSSGLSGVSLDIMSSSEFRYNSVGVVEYVGPTMHTVADCDFDGEELECEDSYPGLTMLGDYEGHRYFISNEPARPGSAQSFAESIGGNLAAINTQAENNFLFTKVSEMVWIGLNDATTEGNLSWTNGEALTFTNYDICNFCSDNSSADDYAIMHPWNGGWSFGSTWNQRKYIVELDCENGVGPEECVLSVTTDNIACLEEGVNFDLTVNAENAGSGFTMQVLSNSNMIPTQFFGVYGFSHNVTVPYSDIDNIVINNTGAVDCTTNFTITCPENDCVDEKDGFTFLGKFSNAAYYLSEGQATAEDAILHCQNSGGRLTTIYDEASNDFLTQHINLMTYIGLNDADQEGNLSWSDGGSFNDFHQNIDICNFCNDNSAFDDYVVMHPWNGGWSFTNKWSKRPYIMQINCLVDEGDEDNEEDPETIVTNTGAIDKGSYLLNAYPNPVESILKIETYAAEAFQATFNVYNAMGQLMLQQSAQINSEYSELQLELNELQSGIYFVELNGGAQHFKTIRFVKM